MKGLSDKALRRVADFQGLSTKRAQGGTMYEVFVGNIGRVLETDNYEEAMAAFSEYVDQSESEYGHAAGESVTLFADGEPVEEYEGVMTGEDDFETEASRKGAQIDPEQFIDKTEAWVEENLPAVIDALYGGDGSLMREMINSMTPEDKEMLLDALNSETVQDYMGVGASRRRAQEGGDSQRDYWSTVKSVAEGIKDEYTEYGGDVLDLLHQAVDGNYWVIYYDANIKVLQYSNNDDYYEDAGVELDTSQGWRHILTQVAFWAMYADVEEALSELGWDGDGFEEDGEAWEE